MTHLLMKKSSHSPQNVGAPYWQYHNNNDNYNLKLLSDTNICVVRETIAKCYLPGLSLDLDYSRYHKNLIRYFT